MITISGSSGVSIIFVGQCDIGPFQQGTEIAEQSPEENGYCGVTQPNVRSHWGIIPGASPLPIGAL